jgi:hypothetical protein
MCVETTREEVVIQRRDALCDVLGVVADPLKVGGRAHRTDVHCDESQRSRVRLSWRKVIRRGLAPDWERRKREANVFRNGVSVAS